MRTEDFNSETHDEKPHTKGATRREQILEVALELFSKKGYNATTTRQITDRLHISPAALYYHFRSKAACLHALVVPYLDLVEEMLGQFPEPVSTDSQIHALLTTYQSALVANLPVAQLLDRDAAVIRDPLLGPRLQMITDRLLHLLAGPEPDTADLVRASSTLGAIRRPALRFQPLDNKAAQAAVGAATAARNSA